MELQTAVKGTHKLTVAAIYRNDGQHTSSRASFVLPSGVLKGEVATWYGGVHAVPAQIPSIERALFLAYPTVTVINIADILTRIETVVDQITFVIHFLAGFSIFAGLTILASSIASMVGVVFANLLTRILLHRLQVGYHLDWPGAVVALIGTAILATGTGWIASYRILGLRPLEVLREE